MSLFNNNQNNDMNDKFKSLKQGLGMLSERKNNILSLKSKINHSKDNVIEGFVEGATTMNDCATIVMNDCDTGTVDEKIKCYKDKQKCKGTQYQTTMQSHNDKYKIFLKNLKQAQTDVEQCKLSCLDEGASPDFVIRPADFGTDTDPNKITISKYKTMARKACKIGCHLNLPQIMDCEPHEKFGKVDTFPSEYANGGILSNITKGMTCNQIYELDEFKNNVNQFGTSQSANAQTDLLAILDGGIEHTLTITAQTITESVGVTVTQGSGSSLVTGTLKTALTGVGMVNVVIESIATSEPFVTTADLIIGSTTVVHANILTATQKKSLSGNNAYDHCCQGTLGEDFKPYKIMHNTKYTACTQFEEPSVDPAATAPGGSENISKRKACEHGDGLFKKTTGNYIFRSKYTEIVGLNKTMMNTSKQILNIVKDLKALGETIVQSKNEESMKFRNDNEKYETILTNIKDNSDPLKVNTMNQFIKDKTLLKKSTDLRLYVWFVLALGFGISALMKIKQL